MARHHSRLQGGAEKEGDEVELATAAKCFPFFAFNAVSKLLILIVVAQNV